MNKLITFEEINVDLLTFEKVELLFKQGLFLIELEQRNQMRNTLQQDAKEAFEKVCGKKSEAKEVEHMTLEGMQKELKENTKHQMEYVNSLKQNTMNARA